MGWRRRAAIAGGLGLCLAGIACAPSPASPDPRVPPATGAPTTLAVIDWKFGAATTTARAVATWGYTHSTSRDVTRECVWETSDPQIAPVLAPGWLASLSEGETDLRVTFRGVSASHRLRVFSGEPPWLVLVGGSTSYVTGVVRDVTLPYPGGGIEGATVEIIAGHNAGRKTMSETGGYYYFYPPFICGPITVRATRAGYREATASSIMCMSGMPDPLMTPNRP